MKTERMTAEGTSNFEQFTDTLHSLLKAVYGEEVTFSEEYPTDADPETHDMPYITYELADRVVSENRGVKQQVFSSKPDPDNEGEIITPLLKWFDCVVRFTIYADTNRESRRWSEEFESFVERYKGLIKNKGISEILFQREYAGSVSERYRQSLSARTLEYFVRIERITEIRSVELREVGAKIGVNDKSEIHYSYVVAEKEDYAHSRRVPIGDSNFLDIYNQSFEQKGEQ